MTAALWIWFGVLVLVCAVWLSRHLKLSRAQRVLPPIHSALYCDGDQALPAISMLVAAKDEEKAIEACLRSILAQDYSELEVIAINDRSTDHTPSIMNRVAADDSRLTVVHIKELRTGWFGKNNAMREGVERARGDWLCFTDADCVQTSERSLTVAMRYALENRLDFLSVLPNLETHGFWERVIQPACGGIMMIWFNPLKVNDPAHRAAYANGAFMLMTRKCYEAIGGHEPVKTEVNEDMHMARRAKAVGQRLKVVSNANLYTVRMYDSLGQMWNGWSRIFYGCFGTLRRLLVSAVVVVIFSLSPWLTLLVAAPILVWDDDHSTAWRYLALAAAAAGAAQLSTMLRFYARSRSNPLFALLYPVGVAVGLGALINAMRRLGGRGTTTWRGTVYRGNQVEAAAK